MSGWDSLNEALLRERLAAAEAEIERWRNGELGCQRRPKAGETIDGPCPDCGRARGLHRRD